jgi:hypothetical protein
MTPSRRLSVIIALLAAAIGPAASAGSPPARPAVTVEAVLPGCRSLIATEGVPASGEAGFCSGLIDGLLYLGAMMPADFCFDVPSEIPHHRVVAAIVEEIDPVYSWVSQQHFRALAIDVLEYKWPCHHDHESPEPRGSGTPWRPAAVPPPDVAGD